MVEAAYVKLKDHLWCLSERHVPMALFNARVADRDKKENGKCSHKIINRTKPVLIANKCLKQKILVQNASNILLDRNH